MSSSQARLGVVTAGRRSGRVPAAAVTVFPGGLSPSFDLFAGWLLLPVAVVLVPSGLLTLCAKNGRGTLSLPPPLMDVTVAVAVLLGFWNVNERLGPDA